MGEGGTSIIDLVVMMTRLESKMDGLRESQATQTNVHADHEQRLRLIEQFVSQGNDHESRIKGLEGNGCGDHELRIKSLEANRWPLPSLAALISIAAIIIAVANMTQNG